jgi:hypothetical protein
MLFRVLFDWATSMAGGSHVCVSHWREVWHNRWAPQGVGVLYDRLAFDTQIFTG